jgi:GntR family transcriptional regulator
VVESDQLPTVKDVVSTVAINAKTMLKAYQELESRGVVAGRPDVGTFVVGASPVLGARELSALRSSLVRGWLREAQAADLSQQGMLALFLNDAIREISELTAKCLLSVRQRNSSCLNQTNPSSKTRECQISI